MPTGHATPYSLTTILVLTDFSKGSQAALEHATARAQLAKTRSSNVPE